MTKIQTVAKTHVGQVRDHNEDSFIVGLNPVSDGWMLSTDEYEIGDKGSVLIVADGMGISKFGLSIGVKEKNLALFFKKIFRNFKFKIGLSNLGFNPIKKYNSDDKIFEKLLLQINVERIKFFGEMDELNKEGIKF